MGGLSSVSRLVMTRAIMIKYTLHSVLCLLKRWFVYIVTLILVCCSCCGLTDHSWLACLLAEGKRCRRRRFLAVAGTATPKWVVTGCG
ncbi:hypothetical protein GQ53DRAFT_353177 [Thozetella sp. PMI_491]|nr:hypothetical protein GQ53DRAFT_353177 [Thozetella sp. PMI_491]